MSGSQNAAELLKEAQNLGFVDFTKSLVSGVFEVVVQSQVDQLKAFAELLAQVSQSVAEYQKDVTGIEFTNAGASGADPELKQYIKNVLNFRLPQNATTYALDQDEFKMLENHLGTAAMNPVPPPGSTTSTVVAPSGSSAGSIDVTYLKEQIYAKLDKETKQQHGLLVEMMRLGFARIDVTDGYVETKMDLHVSGVDEETTFSYAADTRANDWHAGGHVKGVFKKIGFGVSGRYTGSRLRVNVSNTQSVSRTKLDGSMSGQVRISFATSSFGPVTTAGSA